MYEVDVSANDIRDDSTADIFPPHHRVTSPPIAMGVPSILVGEVDALVAGARGKSPTFASKIHRRRDPTSEAPRFQAPSTASGTAWRLLAARVCVSYPLRGI